MEQLSDYLDEEARQEICEAIKAHLTRCTDCRLEVDTLNKTIKLYQNDDPIDMPVTVRANLQAALTKAYDEGPQSLD
jgi:predicted anti-sigma-YlaC factor YlaD